MVLPQVVTPAASTPDRDERPIDLAHLAKMTHGDRALEREVLRLFDRQTELLMARMRQIAPAGLAGMAHTLRGSANGIGAWQVARAAEAVECAAGHTDTAALRAAIERLDHAADAARAVITEMLRAD